MTLELGTPLEHSVASGRVAAPDPDAAADQYELARELLRSEGYEHYEISNWSLPGLASKHNLAYWRNEPYLGVGPGAHSHLAGCRFAGVKSPREHLRLVQDWWGRGVVGPQTIDEQAAQGVWARYRRGADRPSGGDGRDDDDGPPFCPRAYRERGLASGLAWASTTPTGRLSRT